MVEIKLTDDQEMFRKMISDIAKKEFLERAKEIDKTHRFPHENVEILRDCGFMGLTIPEEWGGAGMDYTCYSIAVEEISKICASTGTIFSAHLSLCTVPIEHFGNDEQKEKFLRPLATGVKLGAFALSEPGNGSDAAGMHTHAIEDGDFTF